MVRVYYHDNELGVDFQEAHDSGEAVLLEELARIGVIYRQCAGVAEVDAIARERAYKNRDEITLNEAALGGREALRAKLEVFYEEHLHEDEEIRYILEGEGYFDVRSGSDRWIRCRVEPGDLLILPAGIYHRFTLDAGNRIKAMRLFKDEPKWVALARPVGENAVRESYLQSVV